MQDKSGFASRGKELANLQVLRALAACLVLLHHVAVYAETLRGEERPFATLDDMMGVWGVAIFFALSGYLMARIVTRDPPLVFLAHRLGRIYPTYFAVVGLSVAVFAALGLNFGGISLLGLSLAPTGPRSYPLNVEWTLVFEVAFYVGLFVLASAGLARRIVPLAAGWIVLLAAAALLVPDVSREILVPLHLLPLSAACLPFAGGLLLPRLIEAGGIRPGSALPAVLSAVLLAALLAASCLVFDKETARWPAGIAAILLVGAAVAGPPIPGRGRAIRGVLAFGDWSYVLYLVHPPVLMLAAWACPPHWRVLAYGSVGIAATLAATALLGPLDVAAYRYLRHRMNEAGPAALRRPMAAFLLVFFACAVWGSAETVRNARAESVARRALAALPAEVWTSPAKAAAAIAERGLSLSSPMRGEVESFDRTSPNETLVRAFAYMPGQQDRTLQLGLFCDGRLVEVDRPRRMRKDLAAQPGFEDLGTRRIGYRLRIPTESCAPERAVAVVVDEDGRMAVLTDPRAPR